MFKNTKTPQLEVRALASQDPDSIDINTICFIVKPNQSVERLIVIIDSYKTIIIDLIINVEEHSCTRIS